MSVTIRLATVSDASRIAEIYRPFVKRTPITFEEAVPPAAEMAQRLQETLRRYPWLVCEHGGWVVGYAYATQHRTRASYRWSVDTAVYVDESFHRRRVGHTLYTALFRMLVKQGYVNAFAGITLPNAGSVALHEAMGFQRFGIYRHAGFKLGAWHDVGWWQLELQAPHATPSEPIALDEVQDLWWSSLVE